MNKNKLRAGKSTKTTIIIAIVVFFITLIIGMFLAYYYLSYMEYIDQDKLDIKSAINLIDYVEDPKELQDVTPSFLLKMLVSQIKFWWLYAGVAAIALLNQSNKDEYHGIEQGSASWSDKYDEKLFTDNTGIPVGLNRYITVQNPNQKYYSAHNLNEVVIGGSGAGKTFRKIKPDIMQMYGSYVVTDPKGELYRDCAKFLQDKGYKVRVLNLINIRYSNSYNPFVYMTEEQDVLNVADLFMKNSAGEGEKDDFWSGSAQDLLVSIMVYLFNTKDEIKTFGRCLRLVNSMRYTKQGKIDSSCEIARCFDEYIKTHPNDVVAVNWASLLGTPQETLGSICKTLSTRLRLWAVESVDALTYEDEMDFDNIGKEKTAIFLIIPAARQTYKVIANIFYSQLFERLMLVANRDCNGRLPLLVSCELDEFANIGKIPNFDETLAVVRSHNIRIAIVLQGLSQLKALYEKTWESIIGNCSIFTFLGTNDMDTKEYVSKRLGKTTVRVDTRSYNRGNQGGGQDNENYIQRDLLAPDEIPQAIKPKGKSRKYGGSAIIFLDEFKPFFFMKYDTLNHPLISLTGSSFPKDFHNNTDITKSYDQIGLQHIEYYRNQMKDFFEIAAKKKVEAERVIAEKAQAPYGDESDFKEIKRKDESECDEASFVKTLEANKKNTNSFANSVFKINKEEC